MVGHLALLATHCNHMGLVEEDVSSAVEEREGGMGARLHQANWDAAADHVGPGRCSKVDVDVVR